MRCGPSNAAAASCDGVLRNHCLHDRVIVRVGEPESVIRTCDYPGRGVTRQMLTGVGYSIIIPLIVMLATWFATGRP